METARNIVCPHCAKTNRVAGGRDARDARCGACKSELFNGLPVEVDEAAFDKQISRNSLPVLVDVWAPWCGPCRMMAPAFAEAARILEPDVRLIKLNSDLHQGVATRLGIRGIPALVLFGNGKEVARTAGAMTARQIVDWVRSQIPAGS